MVHPIDKNFRQAAYDDTNAATSQVMEQAEEATTKRAAHIISQRANALGKSLTEKRDKAVIARSSSQIEKVWRMDRIGYEGLDGYYGISMIDYATGEAPLITSEDGARRSQATINIIRPKVDTAYGRYADILLPTDDRNWGLRTTPIPALDDAMQDYRQAVVKKTGELAAQGDNPITISDIAIKEKKVADKKMKGMERKIDDQLTESQYNAQCRKAIYSACKYGTGILKGPFPSGTPRRKWVVKTDGQDTVRVLEYEEGQDPKVKWVDNWDMYPDSECGDDPDNAAYFWERSSLPPRKLRELRGLEGYLEDQIEAVLKEAPSRVAVTNPKEFEYRIQYNPTLNGANYELWEFNGDLDKDDLIALGVDCDLVPEWQQSASACVILTNERVIKVVLNPMETGDLPYRFFRWTKLEGMPWGMGVAREGMWPQIIITNALRNMMDNAGDSSGVNIVIGSGIEPADGIWEVTGKKIWWVTPDGNEPIDVKKAFAQFQVKNNQSELESIINMALKFIDIETMIPTIFDGEQPIVPQTLGATNIMVDSNNITLRSRVKIWDDDITTPLITGFYDWNMQDPDCPEEIKGDMHVDARGTSVLLERDQQGQSAKEILDLKADPTFADIIDWDEVAKKYLIARNMNVILPDDEIKANKKKREDAPPPSDPALEAAKLRADAELQKAQVQAADADKQRVFDSTEADRKRQHELVVKSIEVDLAVMELSEKSGIEISKIKAKLSGDTQKLATQVALATAKNTVPAEEVATPPTEPPGRAPEGSAYQA